MFSLQSNPVIFPSPLSLRLFTSPMINNKVAHFIVGGVLTLGGELKPTGVEGLYWCQGYGWGADRDLGSLLAAVIYIIEFLLDDLLMLPVSLCLQNLNRS